MTNEHTAKRKTLKTKSHKTMQVVRAGHEGKAPIAQQELKSAAGEVQEELTPIRHAAGHAHTH